MRQSRQGRAAPRAPQDAVVLATLAATRTYLALDTPEQLRPYFTMSPLGGVRLHRPSPFPVELYRQLYRDVGKQWHWCDRLRWTDSEIAEHLGNPDIGVWLMGSPFTPMGFFELKRDAEGGVEIAYFGLLPEYIGLKLGGWMLTFAVERAWEWGARRVWLHTCTLDSPHALPNYKARGFVPFKTEDYQQDIG